MHKPPQGIGLRQKSKENMGAVKRRNGQQIKQRPEKIIKSDYNQKLGKLFW